jgi:hypothetical protein
VGLALILSLYQRSKSLDVDLWSQLREPDLPSSALQRDSDQPPLEIEQPTPASPRLTKSGGMPEIDDDFPAELARTTDPRKILTPAPADDD